MNTFGKYVDSILVHFSLLVLLSDERTGLSLLYWIQCIASSPRALQCSVTDSLIVCTDVC
jgi:hypothetical protein